MKAIGSNLIIQKAKLGTVKTKGGLILSKNEEQEIRYILADVVSVGNDTAGIKKGDHIYYDRHAGHKIEIDKEIYHVIKLQDVVVVL